MANAGKEIYVTIWSRLKHLSHKVYPSLPGEVPYPFIHFHSMNTFPEIRNKSHETGRVSVRADIWHDDIDQMGTVLDIADDVIKLVRADMRTENFRLSPMPNGTVTNDLVDRTTGKTLKHYTISVELRYSERR